MSDLRVLHVASEIAPWAKTGGLGDVLGSLPAAMARQNPGAFITIAVPLYRAARAFADANQHQLEATNLHFQTKLGGHEWSGTFLFFHPQPNLRIAFFDSPSLFDHKGLYTPAPAPGPNEPSVDNAIRFGVFNLAVLAHLDGLTGGPVDIVHAHDWHTGILPWLLAKQRTPPASLMTVHNLAYQGWTAPGMLPELDIDPTEPIPFLSLGLEHATTITTVSPSYANEIQGPEFGFGLDPILQAKGVTGILNGIDDESWSPATDTYLGAHFDPQDLTGKHTCRQQLLQEFGLPNNDDGACLMGMVARFDHQKGLDLVAAAVPHLSRLGAKLIVLGTGDPAIEHQFSQLATQYSEHLAVKIAFDVGSAHRITAGTDAFLVPSRFEPCGLTQMYAMRYGSVPIVHAVGGLADTVVDPKSTDSTKQATGFCFGQPTPEALVQALERACGIWHENKGYWRTLMMSGMRHDWSWDRSARAYSDLYERISAPNRCKPVQL